MPHETDYMNPYVKSYFQPNFQIIKQNILMENSEMNKQKNTTNKMKKNNISSGYYQIPNKNNIFFLFYRLESYF